MRVLWLLRQLTPELHMFTYVASCLRRGCTRWLPRVWGLPILHRVQPAGWSSRLSLHFADRCLAGIGFCLARLPRKTGLGLASQGYRTTP